MFGAIAAACLLANSASAAPAPATPAPATPAGTVSVDAEARLKWFREARLGMFIHWGPCAVGGYGIGWARGSERISSADYDKLYLRFNPTKFDADAWMSLAREAGMKYVVPTAKHHDGFCIWPAKTTDYNIMSTPFKRDIVGELAAAARRKNVVFCSYYSILDWWHPLYPTDSPGGNTTKPSPNMPAYMEYMKDQLREIISRYRPAMLWFDGEWEGAYTPEMAKEVEDLARTMNPRVLLNNRVGKLREAGDFDTPEQKVGSFQRGRAWESCITLGTRWSWRPNDTIKSFDEVMTLLVQTVTGDGNLLLNIGPDETGVIEPRQADRLRELGAWMRKHGESIYKTRGGPYMNSPWGGMTCRGQTAYLHLLAWDGKELQFKDLPAKVLRARVMTGGEAVVAQARGRLFVSFKGGRPAHATVIRMDLDGNAEEMAPMAEPLLASSQK